MANESTLGLELRLGLPGTVSSEVKNDLKCEPVTKNQVMGWPPVCSHRRKNSLERTKTLYVKVSVDGAAFLRKIDLEMYKCYEDLAAGLQVLFGCFIEKNECIPIYEDKDGDWMLVGDVPWEMFIGSCKRLRIMKKSCTQ